MTAPEEHMQLAAWLRNPWQKCDDTPRGPIPEWQAALMFEAANVIDGYSRSAVITQAAVAAAYEAAAQAVGWEAYVADTSPQYLSDWQRGLVAGQQAMCKAIRALATPDQIAALAAERAATVTVKPLEWVKDTMPNAAPQRYRAATHDGTGDYSVSGSKNSDAWQWFRNGYFVDGHQHHKPMPLDAAKAAAQADYDARIRSAITITSGTDSAKMHKAVEALRESVLAIQYLDERAPSGTTPPTLAKITAVLAEIGGA